MSNRPTIKKHGLIRPNGIPQKVEKLVLRKGKPIWLPDDGKPGIAFSGLDLRFFGGMGSPTAWYSKCDCTFDRKNCPKELAMKYTCNRFHAANGQEVF